LFSVDIDGSNFRKLLPMVKEAVRNQTYFKNYNVIARAPEQDSDDIFVRDDDGDFDSNVLRLNTKTGRSKNITFDKPRNVLSWTLDHAGIPRVAEAGKLDPTNGDIIQLIYYRSSEKSKWEKIYEAKYNEGRTIGVVGFDFDNKKLFVTGRFGERDKSALYTWDFDTNKPKDLVAEDPLVDMDGDGSELIIDYARKKLVGFKYQAMQPKTVFFDPEYADLTKKIETAFPEALVQITPSGSEARMMINVRGVNNPGQIYLADLLKDELIHILTLLPALDGKKLSPQTSISYIARDGLPIPAYLTLPEGTAHSKLPLVVYVHGGPHARDLYGYDDLGQLLASRGYAILQPQFRMSTGFGWKHHTAGWKQWGLAMQDDVTDGVKTLVEQGIVDPNRVCIMGASSGGYATMYGLIKDPDLYKCGINFVGVTDISLMFSVTWSDMTGIWLDDLGKKMHGDPKLDSVYMKKVSALENADRIKAPVLMAYGSDDMRVPLIHGEKMRDKLLKQGTPLQWVVFNGEGHGWVKKENRLRWGEMVLKFINSHIGN
jgi:dipeptidyl aminopeptidase/acylaminoacyl peptidase